jgi:hypothetical protein
MDGLKIVSIDVTLDALSNVMETAISAGHTHGIGYWAEVKHIEYATLPKKPSEERVSFMVLRDVEGGGAAEATNTSPYRLQRGDPKLKAREVRVTTATIKAAIEKMLCDPDDADAKGWLDRLVSGDVPDGPLSDAIVQVACFGKVIYG